MPFRKQRPEVAPGIEQMHPRWERILRGIVAPRRLRDRSGPFPRLGRPGLLMTPAVRPLRLGPRVQATFLTPL